MTEQLSADIDEARLHEFVGQMLGDHGGAFSVPLSRIGNKLGLYKMLHADGPMTACHLAARTNTAERYIRECAAHHAASGHLDYDAAASTFGMTGEQAMVFAVDTSPVNMLGASDTAVAAIEDGPKIEVAFHNGAGLGWSNHSQCLFCEVEKFFRPGYMNHIVQQWLPSRDGGLRADLTGPRSRRWAPQAGESRLAVVMTAAGFATVRGAAEKPFNMILEARP